MEGGGPNYQELPRQRKSLDALIILSRNNGHDVSGLEDLRRTHGGGATACRKCTGRWGKNGGVAKPNGGRREGAGRKSKAQKALERAAKKRKGEEKQEVPVAPEVQGLPENKTGTTPPYFFFFNLKFPRARLAAVCGSVRRDVLSAAA